ncbi:MAG: hypothetical protein R2726_16480 [Acidimicrobiales bacterium]
MTAYDIDRERTHFSVAFRPGIKGLGARVTGVEGTFEATVDDDGVVDWDRPVHGSFTMAVRDLEMGNRFLTFGARQWLDPRRFESVRGELRDVEPNGADGFTAGLQVYVKDMDVRIVGRGRFVVVERGRITVRGTSMVDPRAFKVMTPPFLNFMVLARWTIHLTPTADPD